MKTEYKITKEEHSWTSEEKIKWLGYGEWVEEADVVELEYLGYQAVVLRILKREPFCEQEAYFGGHFCGYVKIPDTHPFFRKKGMANELESHCGITFDEVHEDHWIGYDCGHSCDYIPTMEHMRKNDAALRKIQEMFPLPEGFEEFALFNPVYRNMQYCIDTCVEMIDQLINISMTTSIEKSAQAMNEYEKENPS